jgi:hypothetical protein
VRNWFQNFAVKWVKLWRYHAVRQAAQCVGRVIRSKVGALYKLTHSLKAPGFNH